MDDPSLTQALLAHIARCRNAALPGGRRRFLLSQRHAGYVTPEFAARLSRLTGFAQHGDAVTCAGQHALHEAVQTLCQEGVLRFRDEAFDVRETETSPPIATIDRGALPAFGIAGFGVHINGIVYRDDIPHLWLAKRAPGRNEAGKLDHIAAGGIPAGLSPEACLRKEAAEEAAIPPALAALARPVATIRYTMARPEGLRRDTLYCYDLILPPDFTPRPADGEVESFVLMPFTEVVRLMVEPDAFKFNVNLVLIELFLRHHALTGKTAAALRHALADSTPAA
jgi:8-oxo-dGTP pyrophosphatase MutT (NUDIX family)